MLIDREQPHTTRYVCLKELEKSGGKAGCCFCTKHECEQDQPPAQEQLHDTWGNPLPSLPPAQEQSNWEKKVTTTLLELAEKCWDVDWAPDIHGLAKFRSFVSQAITKAKADERKRLVEEIDCLKIITPSKEPPKNKLSQNQVFGAGQMNMLIRVKGAVLKTLNP